VGLAGARCDQIERLTEGFGLRVVGPCILNPVAHAPAASGL
jgi:hypothetical protein